jgi:hypothetical protein
LRPGAGGDIEGDVDARSVSWWLGNALVPPVRHALGVLGRQPQPLLLAERAPVVVVVGKEEEEGMVKGGQEVANIVRILTTWLGWCGSLNEGENLECIVAVMFHDFPIYVIFISNEDTIRSVNETS